MDARYFTLDLAIHRQGESYHLTMNHSDPGSQAQVAPLRGIAAIDPPALIALELDLAAYGAALAAQLFAEPAVKQRFLQVEAAAQATDSFLRLSLSLDPSAQELHGLRWELLRHPETGAAITSAERLLFSRFMVSRDFRPIKLRARAELRALIAVSAPPAASLARLNLAPVDMDGEVARVKTMLADVAVTVLGGPGDPFTVTRLIDALRDGVDILYLVSHGMFNRSTGTPALVLQNSDETPVIVKAEELTTRITELQTGPRLVVLASCQSGGDGATVAATAADARTLVQSTLAGRLAEAGVPAVLAMQGHISMATIAAMMPVFFKELLRDGQIDRALAAARGVVRQQGDVWMPVLFSRLTGGCIWYTPGFSGVESQTVWKRLVKPVREGKVVPILGPGLLESICGTPFQTARRLADRAHFPLGDEQWDDLPRVSQYMAVKESRYNAVRAYQDQLLADLIAQHGHWLPAAELPPQQPNPKLGRLIALVGNHQLHDSPDDPYRILAELPASVYLTTNFDPLLEAALKEKQRTPLSVVSRWRYQRAPETAATQAIREATAKEPIVYHAFGAFGKDADDTLVLTEDDYFDFLIGTSSDRLIPSEIESALVDNSLVFLGFRLTDWSFRVLFRLMMSLPGRERLKNYCHVAVQVAPDLQAARDAAGLRAYLSEYFGKQANIDIFWGSAAEFLTALDAELRAAGAPVIAAPEQGADDEWAF